MSTLIAGTVTVTPDEACFCLKEVNERTPDSRGIHRFQCIQVIRQDRITEYRSDLGPAESFDAAPFWLITGVRDPQTGRIYCEHTVAEAMEMAERRRMGLGATDEKPLPYDLINGHYDQQEQKQRRARRQSTFGYGGKVERN